MSPTNKRRSTRRTRAFGLGLVATLIALPALAAAHLVNIEDVDLDFNLWAWEEVNDDCFDISDAVTVNKDDAFDGYGEITVDGECYEPVEGTIVGSFDPITGAATTDVAISGETLVTGVLEISGQWYFFVDRALARQTITLTNTGTAASPFTLVRESNLGSDDETVQENASTGGPAVLIVGGESLLGVQWMVTSDGDDEDDPVLLHVLGSPASDIVDTAEWDDNDNILHEYTLTIGAGETVSFVWFVQLFDWSDSDEFDAALASAEAAAFTELSPALLIGLDLDAIGSIMNWEAGAATVTPPPPSVTPPPPSLSCSPTLVAVGQTVTCTVNGGPADFAILWRAAYNPPFASAGVTLDASGTGTFSFVVPAAALGQNVTVELVDWTAPLALGVAGGRVPTSVPSGGGPAPSPILLLSSVLLAGVVLARSRRTYASNDSRP